MASTSFYEGNEEMIQHTIERTKRPLYSEEEKSSSVMMKIT